MEMHVLDQLVHTTVRIQCFNGKGEAFSGTGFAMRFCESDGQSVTALITNKHVIEGAVKGVLTFHTMDANGDPVYGKYATVTLNQFEDSWVKHPDKDVDLAALPLAGAITILKNQGTEVFIKTVGRDLLAMDADLQDLTAVEDILMIGYPNSLWDAKNNFPITRRGVTATPPYIDFDGKNEFMIDCACFPGSSGSPIFLSGSGSYANKSGGYTLGARLKFIGVLWGGPMYTTEGKVIVVPIPTKNEPVALSQIPMNLGYCIKAEQLLAFDDHFGKLLKAEQAAKAQAAAVAGQQAN